MNRMKLMFTIVDRGDGLALAKLYAQNGVQLLANIRYIFLLHVKFLPAFVKVVFRNLCFFAILLKFLHDFIKKRNAGLKNNRYIQNISLIYH